MKEKNALIIMLSDLIKKVRAGDVIEWQAEKEAGIEPAHYDMWGEHIPPHDNGKRTMIIKWYEPKADNR